MCLSRVGWRKEGSVHSWALLHYKIPPEPTARRVFVWRKLKRLGAILLHDAIFRRQIEKERRVFRIGRPCSGGRKLSAEPERQFG